MAGKFFTKLSQIWSQIKPLILSSALITSIVFYTWTQDISYLILSCTIIIIIEIRRNNQC